MWLQWLLLGLGLALLIKGGDLFVSAAVRIAGYSHLPKIVVGTTLVSLATTSPELAVSIMAGTNNESGLAIGNAVGSCICNIGLVLGLTASFKHVDVHPPALRRPLLVMFGFGGLLLIMTFDLVLSRWQGLVLIGCGLSYFVYDFIWHLRDRRPADKAEASAIGETVGGASGWFQSATGSTVQFLLGAALVIVGSRFLVGAAIRIAEALHIPSLIIGLTVVAIGTSLPELVTAVTSSRRNVSDLAVGNVLGANIANLTLVVGTAATLSDVTMSRLGQLYNFPAMLVIFGLLFWMLHTDRRVTRKEGVTLVLCYAFYLCGLALLTAVLKR